MQYYGHIVQDISRGSTMRKSTLLTLARIAALPGIAALASCGEPADTAGQGTAVPPAAVATAPPPVDTTTDPSCDRQCLIDATDQYVDAIIAHEIFRAPI